MPAGHYHFHCTDGEDAVLDLSGNDLRTRDDVHAAAARAARAVMEGCGSRLDWSGWIVDVHDSRGRHVLTLAFDDADTVRQAA
jgi:uncharacterized protein DUF6894